MFNAWEKDLGIEPRTWELPQRMEAVKRARDLGKGVRMEVGNMTTTYYADLNVPVGQIEIYMPRKYKGQPEFATRLTSPDQFFDAFGFTWEDEEDDDT